MKNLSIKRIFALLLALCLLASIAVTPAMAATVEDATIYMDEKCKLTIYKYDFTNAAKDGIWSQNSYVSTGQYDANVNDILGTATRKGDTDSSSDLGSAANGSSNGYAIKGVEFTYLKVATPYQYTESEHEGKTSSHVEVLYKFDQTKAADLLAAIGLSGGKDSYAPANELDTTAWFYRSDVLNAALQTALVNNATTVKNALEAYVKANGGTKMTETDANGRSIATDLEVGLYLLVETKVPEMVTATCNPFFVSLPMTNVDGGGDGSTGNDTVIDNGGSAWLYDVTVYPKNESGIVTLTKEVREAIKDTGKNDGSLTDITDGYAHTATASAGDTVEYQIISTLPTITSAATNISVYTFRDILARGMSYESPVKIEWFKNATCKPEDLVATWTVNDATPKFSVTETKNSDGSHTLEISMTEAGLNEINTANTNAANNNGALYAGYSNYTIRITYSATLNPDESMVYGDAGNPNKVVLTWARTSSNYLDTLVDDCHIYTYGINLTKEFSDGKDDQELFDDVLFIAQNASDGYYVQAKLNEDEGIWYVTGHTEKESSATSMHPVDWNDKKGQLVIKGLEDDEYILTEVQTANSYTLLKENIKVDISVADDATRPCNIYADDVLGVIQNDPRFDFDGGLDLKLANIPQGKLAHNMLTASATVDSNAVVMINDEMDATSTNALATLTVVNTKGFNLPQTGEITATMLPIIGGTLLSISMLFVVLLFVQRRKQKEI